MFKKALLSAAVVSALAAGSLTMPSAAHATASDPTGKYTVVSPTRIADSRSHLRLSGRLSANHGTTLQVAGLAGVPSKGVQSVVVDITVVNPSAQGFLTAYASGTTRPATSDVNYPKAWTGATTTTVPVGADGKIALYAGSASVDVVVDVQGWYAAKGSTATPGSLYASGEAARVADTRTGGSGPLAPGDELIAGYRYSDLTSGMKVTAFAVNITAVGQSSGYLTAAAESATTTPKTSVVNFAKGETSPNFAIVPVSGSNAQGYLFSVMNTSTGTAHVIVDIVGVYYTDTQNIGLTHQVFAPTRVADTRWGIGTGKTPVGANSVRTVDLPTKPIDSVRTAAVEGTLTGVNPSTGTYLAVTAGPGGGDPGVSMLNLTAHANRSNAFVSDLGGTSGRQVAVYNAFGKIDVVADVSGRFDATDEMLAHMNNPSGAALTKMSSVRSLGALAHGTAVPTRRGPIR